MKKFYKIKIGREVVHGEGYARVLKRNSYTVVYNEEQGGRLNVKATYNTFCYIGHTVAIEGQVPVIL